MRLKIGVLGISALSVVLVASGCSKTTNTSTTQKSAAVETGAISYAAADNAAPAAAVPGATKGGTVGVFITDGFEHLDPARNYVTTQQLTAELLYRSLTGYKEDGKGGLKVVGDLATDPGTDVDKDCKTWKYTIRSGVKFEDGTTVTSKDVAYGIARSFSPDLSEGPHYIQQWLAGTNYNATYKGPYNGGSALPPGVTTPDDSTIIFTFPQAHCDMPFAATLSTSAPVPQAKDTKADYDRHPISSGPYMIDTYNLGTNLTLKRNPYWDPKSDPLRTAYPDAFKFDFTVEPDQVNDRLIADAGTDQTYMSWMNVPPAEQPKTQTADVKARTILAPTQFVRYYYINTQRVTDLNERKALNIAMDKDAALKAYGGAATGTPATTLLSPTVSGYKKFDVFGVPTSGDPAKAKALLAGKTPTIVLAYANTPPRAAQAQAVAKSLDNAGFKVTTKALPSTSYYTTLGDKTNAYDLYLGGWGSDWPDAATVIPPLFDSRNITPTGNNGLSYLQAPDVNTEIDRIEALKSSSDRQAAWGALDQKIMTEYAPVVPLDYDNTFVLYGSKLGNVTESEAFGDPGLINVYVKQ